MTETGKATVGNVARGASGLATLAVLVGTVVVLLLGAFGVIDMEGVVVEGTALAYVVGVGTFAMSPLVAVGLVAVSLFNAVGVVAIGAGSASGIVAISGGDAQGIIAISAGGRANGMLVGIGDEARGALAIAYSGRTAKAFGNWPPWPGAEAETD
ncbi:MAG: hypothetical protein OXG33_09895 [Chloroflexi bacterium]|nr:hypothetical protein [Chloroflexota bacterium]